MSTLQQSITTLASSEEYANLDALLATPGSWGREARSTSRSQANTASVSTTSA